MLHVPVYAIRHVTVNAPKVVPVRVGADAETHVLLNVKIYVLAVILYVTPDVKPNVRMLVDYPV
jgi:hypothetical protein